MKQADAPHHKMTLVLKHWLPSFPHKSPATSDTEQPSSSPDKRDKKLTSEDVGAIQVNQMSCQTSAQRESKDR